MSTNKCPPNDDTCVEEGFPGNFQAEEPPCDHTGGLSCYYFHAGGGSPRDTPGGPTHCTHQPFNDDDVNWPCYREGAGWFLPALNTGHWVKVGDNVRHFMTAYDEVADFAYSALPFRSRGLATYIFTFDPAAILQIDACCTEHVCGVYNAWVGRCKIMGSGHAWDIWCNIAARVSMSDDWPGGPPPPNGDPRWCRQSFFRELRIENNGIYLAGKGGTSFSGHAQMAYSTLGMMTLVPSVNRGHCFPYTNHFCFTDYCGDDDNDKLFTCIEGGGGAGGVVGEATETLELTYAMTYSTQNQTFPHANPYDVYIKNLLLDFFARKSCGEVVHSVRSTAIESLVPYLWTKTEVWDIAHPDEVEYPVVTFPSNESTVYPKPYEPYAAVPIWGYSYLTGIRYPMELRLMYAVTRLEMFVEKLYDSEGSMGSWEHRMFGDMHVSVFLQAWLKPEAYVIDGPLKFFKTATEPWDHRFADPNRPGYVYTQEKLVIKGPNNERIPSHVSWKGRRCELPVAGGNAFYHPCDEWVSAYSSGGGGANCCPSLQVLERSPIYGRHTNINDITAPQLYEGQVTIVVPGLNEPGQPLRLDCGCVS